MKNVQLPRSPFETDEMGLYMIDRPRAKDIAEIKPSKPFNVNPSEF